MDNYRYASTHGDPYGKLNLCLSDILAMVKPFEDDRLKRLNTLNELTTQLQSVESLRGVTVRPFGSFTSNLYAMGGDLDISVELSHSSPNSTGRNRKQRALRDIMKVLRRTGVARNIHYIPSARVPLLKFESGRQNISCDVSIDNQIGHIKSKILLWISEIDGRFRDMVLLIKEWAKSQNINDPKSGTLNSYSLCLLVIFHFQTCKPAILPPLKDIYPGNVVDITGHWFSVERQIEDVCVANIARFKYSRQRNHDSLSQLLISFFEKFSTIERLSTDHVISTYTGQLERIVSNPRWMEKAYKLFIEDPFEQPDNAARAVGLRELSIISNAFLSTSGKLSSDYALSDRNTLLSILVGSRINLHHNARTQGNYFQRNVHRPSNGYASHHVPIGQFQNVSRLNGQQHTPPSSTVTMQMQATMQRQGTMHVQGNQAWRPRYSNSSQS